MREFKRVINRKGLLFFVLVFLINICFFINKQMGDVNKSLSSFKNKQKSWIIEFYSEFSLEEAKDVISEDLEWINQYNGMNEETDSPVFNRFLRLSPDEQEIFLKVLQETEEQIKYAIRYPAEINQIQINAEQLKTFSIFSDKDSFTYKNIIKTGNDFKRLINLKINLSNNQAVENFVKYYYHFYLSLLVMIFVIYTLSSERDNVMWELLYTTKNGRMKLALNRVAIVLIDAFLVTATLYFSTLLTSFCIYGGIDSLQEPVQSIETFSRFSIPMSQIGYIMYNFFVGWFALAVLSYFIWMLFILNRKRNIALLFTGLIIGLEVYLNYKIDEHSIYVILKKINIIRFLQVNEILSKYANRGIGNKVISETMILIAVLVIMFCLFIVCCIFASAFMRPKHSKSLLTKLYDICNERYQHILAQVSFFGKELHKLIVTCKCGIIILTMMLISIYFVSYGKVIFSDSAKERDKIYLSDGGEKYSAICDLVDARKNEYLYMKSKLDEAVIQYENGEISGKELDQISTMSAFSSLSYSQVREFENKQIYLSELEAETGVKGYMMSERGYEQIIGNDGKIREFILLIVLLVSVVLLTSSVLQAEISAGTKYIINSTSGRGKYKVKRLLFTAFIMIAMFILVYGLDFIYLYNTYGMPYLNAPLMSLEFMRKTGLKITIFQFILQKMFFRFASMIGIFGLTYFISSKTEGIVNKLAQVAIILGTVIYTVIVSRLG